MHGFKARLTKHFTDGIVTWNFLEYLIGTWGCTCFSKKILREQVQAPSFPCMFLIFVEVRGCSSVWESACMACRRSGVRSPSAPPGFAQLLRPASNIWKICGIKDPGTNY